MNPVSNNVVIFPKAPREGAPLQSLEEIIEHISDNRKEHISFLVDDISEYVFSRAEMEGFHVLSEDYIKPTMLFVESLRAMLYKTARIDHPLHKITEDVIVVSSEEKEED